MNYIIKVCNWYKKSFQEIRDCPPPVDLTTEKQFAKLIDSVYERHSSTLMQMAKGAHEIRTILNKDVMSFAEYDDVQRNLNDFYMSRIGVRSHVVRNHINYKCSTIAASSSPATKV